MFNFFKKKKDEYDITYFDTIYALKNSSKLNSFIDDSGCCHFYATLDEEDKEAFGEFHDVRVEYYFFDKVFIFTYAEWFDILKKKADDYLIKHPEDKEKVEEYLSSYKKLTNL